MLIAIIHYHLNGGGVTGVIAGHLRSLDKQAEAVGNLRVAILHGGKGTVWPEDRVPGVNRLQYSVCFVPGLDYHGCERVEPRELAARLRATLMGAGGTPDTAVLHIHNHALGKNGSLPGAIAELCDEGWPLVLQIHDFAEDFRPLNYRCLREGCRSGSGADWGAVAYPQAGHVHYAVLNRRDLGILGRAGVESERIHLLPNAVADPGPMPAREPVRTRLAERFGIPADRPLLLYPVRGIRRKNLGEALLWSALAGGEWHVGVTLRPLNPVELRVYDGWKSLAAAWRLAVGFEIGDPGGLALPESLAAADRMLTTSVAEGFGLVYLESWLAGKTLVGRDLPEVTGDFRREGLRLDGLCPRLAVPLGWIGLGNWRRQFEGMYGDALVAYGRRLPEPAELDRAVEGLVADGLVDFGVLPLSQQRLVLELVAGDQHYRYRLLSQNDWLGQALWPDSADREVVEDNARTVRDRYSEEGCGRRLVELYDAVARAPRGSDRQAADGERILDEFLGAARFHPICVEP
ncbi:MAG: glycosyltransferase family protein [Thermoguttaceae bacterium]